MRYYGGRGLLLSASMPTALETSIYRTLAYFAYFKYPLTSFEIWKWLLEPRQETSLAEVVQTLSSSTWLSERLESHQGFYALEHVAEQRHDRHLRFLDAMRKYQKVERVIKLLGRLPWIDGIAVCNSLSWHHTNGESDIDLFIVAKPGRVWSARMLSTLPIMLLRQRPGEAKLDPMCLSFFSTESAFDFAKLKIGSADPYLAYWCQSLVPVVSRGAWQARFQLANAWLREVLPNAAPVLRASRFRSNAPLRWPWLPVSERLLKQFQIEKLPPAIRKLMNKDTRVVVNDQMLKFHEQDSRDLIRYTLEGRMTRL